MNFNPKKLKYSFKEFIGIYEEAFSLEECNSAIEIFEKYDRMGYSYSRIGECPIALNLKDDSAINLVPSNSKDLDCGDNFIESFHNRFYNYLYPLYNLQYPILQQLRKHQSKHIKIQKTYPTQGYHVWHCEHDASHEDRILSWILYLNDVEEGGETEFLYQSLRFKPKAGTFILFPAHFTHTHRGNPPLKGCKYIATGWIEYSHTTEPQGQSNFPDLNEVFPDKKISYQ